ncbi:MAG: hypothetical protein R2710_00305 [Acidimicrobiales bacterium]
MLLGDGIDARRHGGREHDRLAVGRCLFENGLDVFGEPHVEHLVGLVENDGADLIEFERVALDVIERTAGGGNHDVHATIEGAELPTDGLAAVDRHHLDPEIAPVAGKRLAHLYGQLPRRYEHQRRRDRGGPRPDAVEDRQRKRGRLPRARCRLPEHVAP